MHPRATWQPTPLQTKVPQQALCPLLICFVQPYVSYWGSSSLTPMILFIAMMLSASIVLVSLIVIGQRHLDKECNHNLKPVAHK